jgi:glycosyltransferase involved in cell wall biosynthesis
MRIIIDLQAAQSSSRLRGIGRYALSLADGIVRLRGDHDVYIVLSGLFPSTIEPLRAHFKPLLPASHVRVWYAPAPVNEEQLANQWRTHAAQTLREAFIADLKPDVVLISSLFEGYSDNSVTSIGSFNQTIPTAVILYDLIPLLYPKKYLANANINAWYRQKIELLQRANLLLAISASAKEDVSTAKLNIAPSTITNISAAASDHFKKINIDDNLRLLITTRYHLTHPFLMYTGGVDHRKNIDGLIKSYALLPLAVRKNHQLAIVCAIHPNEQQSLMHLAKQHGLTPSEILFTGYVSDDDLRALYHLCKAFIFPSWHEGFGLPILEAMLCGAPVIGSNTSSIPEVIGYPDALFDPFNEQAMAHKIEAVLTDESFRQALITHGLKQAAHFSWDKTAKAALNALEALHQEFTQPIRPPRPTKRPKLAYVSPLPPSQSGIAAYSAMLIPALAKHYEIDVIVDQPQITSEWITQHCSVRDPQWLLTHADTYDRVMYHLGNSTHHAAVFNLIHRVPGVLVLHDFYLSGILSHLESHTRRSHLWSEALYHSHGYRALAERYQTPHVEYVNQYPCNRIMVDASLGVIFHANESKKLAQRWLGPSSTTPWFHVPLLSAPASRTTKQSARARLNLSDQQHITCSFGFVAHTKLNQQILDAWVSSDLSKHPDNRLIFVGETGMDEYGQHIQAMIHQQGLTNQVFITGWVADDVFNDYLASADLSIQLRAHSRGETSAAVLACMAQGLPTIVNAHGSMAELPTDCVWMLNDAFTLSELVHAIHTLTQNKEISRSLTAQATAFIQQHHTAESCAASYAHAMEDAYACQSNTDFRHLTKRIAALPGHPTKKDHLRLAEAISINQSHASVKQLLIDISHWTYLRPPSLKEQHQLQSLLQNPPDGYRIEPIYAAKNGKGYRYARKRMLRWLGCPTKALTDDFIVTQPGDAYLALSTHAPSIANERLLQQLRNRGVLWKNQQDYQEIC